MVDLASPRADDIRILAVTHSLKAGQTMHFAYIDCESVVYYAAYSWTTGQLVEFAMKRALPVHESSPLLAIFIEGASTADEGAFEDSILQRQSSRDLYFEPASV